MPGTRWTDQELKLLAELYPVLSTRAVSEQICRSVHCIQKMAQKKGIGKTKEAMRNIKIEAAKMCTDSPSRFKAEHGRSGGKDRTYTTWQSMHQRCYYSSHKSYKNYGGRGITVCDSWGSFARFLQDMGERPQEMTLGRKDNDGNYNSVNCEWQSYSQQARNRRSSRMLTAFGQTKVMAEWCEKFSIASDTLSWRIRSGMHAEAALTKPVQTRNRA